MKSMQRIALAAMLSCALAAGGAGGAGAAGSGVILRDGQVYRMDSGQKRLVEKVPFASVLTDKGVWSWMLVDPEANVEMKGAGSGHAFFRGEDDRPAGFLPLPNPRFCHPELSPSGEKLACFCGGDERRLSFYLAGADGRSFVRKASFCAESGVFWIAPHRFVFTLVDESKGLRSGNPERRDCSVALYDTIEEELTVLRQATATRDFACLGFDSASGKLYGVERSVKAEKDWSSESKITKQKIEIPIPAAG